MKKSSLKFFRKQFKIPKRLRLRWCIIVCKDGEERHLRLGVRLVDTNKAIDVATRQFVEIEKPAPNAHFAFYATRKAKRRYYVYYGEEGSVLTLPKSFIDDIYFRCTYSKELMQTKLL